MNTEEQRGFVPFEFKGDLNSFEKEFMPKIELIDLSKEMQRRNLISSVWLFANEQWSKGYEKGKSDPEFSRCSDGDL